MKKYCLTFVLLTAVSNTSYADEKPGDSATGTEKTSDRLLPLQRVLMEQTVVTTVLEEAENRKAVMRKEPLLVYGDETRKIRNSSVWVWLDQGRPVAIQKVEDNLNFTRGGWTYCFTSISPKRVQVRWPNAPTYTSKEPVAFLPIPNAIARDRKSVWSFQARQLARKFSARVRDGNGNGEEIKTKPAPLLEYNVESESVEHGAIFTLSSGTNPSFFVVIELRRRGDQLQWYYAISRATAEGMTIRFRNEVVKTGPYRGRGNYPTWMYTFLAR